MAKLAPIVLLAIVVWIGWRFLRSRRRDPSRGRTDSLERLPDHAADAPAATDPPTAEATPAEPESPPPTLEELASRFEDFYDDSAHPQSLEPEDDFRDGVARMVDPAMPLDQVVNYATGDNGVLAAMAAEALAQRDDTAPALDRLLAILPFSRPWTDYFLFRCFVRHAREPVIGRVLAMAHERWADNPVLPQFVSDFIDARVAAGEPVDIQPALQGLEPDRIAGLGRLLDRLTTRHATLLRMQLAEWQRTRLDHAFLESIGRVIEPGDEAQAAPTRADWPELVEGTCRALTGTRSGAVMIVGEPGVGKRTFVQQLTRRLARDGWTVFQASGTDIMAGQTYLGELEKRLRELLEHLSPARRVVWCIPALHELVYAGQHRQSPIGVLDMLMPAIESGRLRVIGITTPPALERLVQQRPRVRGAFKSIRIEPMPVDAARDLAQAVATQAFADAGIAMEASLVADAVELARHYYGARALPGSVIEILRDTRARLADGGARQATRDDLLDTLTLLTGLPRAVLDDRQGLDPAELRAYFDARVMGQPEAVSCLVDRIAMLKAGLTDPSRPIGVLLFAGPTGTGKTEVAKTAAEYLFGSSDRMIRLDMSEFQDPSSLVRIVGDGAEAGMTDALVNRIRKQPFSVVLLDEFEKAHPRVWDLFLQVFDEGRLTDALGGLADFRHSIIIVTTNLGATAHQGSSLGFTEADSPFSEAQVTRAIAQAFRPEFVNRLDRVVVFRPLSRTVMREILRKELHNVLQRRGFRSREWAVEWEDSALDFLLDRGFTKDMGARPLRRAIEEHVLAPLAMTIVEHRFPEGDQFLFVRSDGRRIDVVFVDPDTDRDAPALPAAASAGSAGDDTLSLGALMLSPKGTAAESGWLGARLARLDERLAHEAWAARKEAALARMNDASFWQLPERHATLDEAERMDRIDAATATARSLLQRLARQSRHDGDASATLIARLAEQVHHDEAALADFDAGHASDVFLAVDRVAAHDGTPASERSWTRSVADMYQAWARRRRMQCTVLRDDPDTSVVMAIGGLGAHHILAHEHGLHVLEVPASDGDFDRHTVRVRVVPQPLTPRPVHEGEADYALRCIAARGAPPTTIVRRYREKPSPLVRDAVDNWRTGRLRLVLEGAFDCAGGL